jgi:hypothetical protein
MCRSKKATDIQIIQKAKAQILAQKLYKFKSASISDSLLIVSNMGSRTGALTDVSLWTFWHDHEDEWYVMRLNSKTNKEAKKVLCKLSSCSFSNCLVILTFLVVGHFPSLDPNDPLYIDKAS